MRSFFSFNLKAHSYLIDSVDKTLDFTGYNHYMTMRMVEPSASTACQYEQDKHGT